MDARLEPAGRIDAGALRIDRFTFELSGGDLYVLPHGGAAGDIAVYLGDGVVRCYPPDGVEHQQVEKFLDEDLLEERFDRFVFWLTWRQRLPATRPRERPTGPPRRDGPMTFWTDRREALLEHQFHNPDSRLLLHLLAACADIRRTATTARTSTRRSTGTTTAGSRLKSSRGRSEEVTVFHFDHRNKVRNVWMAFHALAEFDADAAAEQCVLPAFRATRKRTDPRPAAAKTRMTTTGTRGTSAWRHAR